MTTMAICDANSFYCSCELAFRSDLAGKPVVVVGNNDGCIVARSATAKPLLPMGAPIFQHQQRIKQYGVIVFSSNYALYHEFSQRIHAIMGRYTDQQEIFSIDESFLHLGAIPPADRATAMQEMRQTILQETGIPVSVGVATTKVLAKLAADQAKTTSEGIWMFDQETGIDQVLAATTTEDIWYIGTQRAKTLKERFGITTGLQLKRADIVRIRRALHVPVARVVCELRGISALPLQTIAPPRMEIVCARSFGRSVTSLPELCEAAAAYTAAATRRLWQQHSLVATLCVSLMTNRFREDQPQYHASCVVHLSRATNTLPELLATAQETVTRLYQSGYHYRKVGIMLTDLTSDTLIQGDLFAADPDARQQRLIATIRAIEAKFGKGAIFFAATGGPTPAWAMRQEHCSPHYLTNWQELPIARA
jgi:DNA polymerase V